MAETTFDVKIWKTEKYVGAKVTTYKVIWKVAGLRWKVGHRTSAAAESFRAELVSAQRKGEAFDVASGRPVSSVRKEAAAVAWYDFACRYVDARWSEMSPNHRMGTANVLMSVTTALLAERMPTDEKSAVAIRSALVNWAFNMRRGSNEQPVEVTAHLDWARRNSPDLTVLMDAKVMRELLRILSLKLDGSRASRRTAAWRRSILSTVLNRAVEDELLATNPVGSVRSAVTKTVDAVDRRSVANPSQARTLLDSVAKTHAPGSRWSLSSAPCTTRRSGRRKPSTSVARTSTSLLRGGDGSCWRRRSGGHAAVVELEQATRGA